MFTAFDWKLDIIVPHYGHYPLYVCNVCISNLGTFDVEWNETQFDSRNDYQAILNQYLYYKWISKRNDFTL